MEKVIIKKRKSKLDVREYYESRYDYTPKPKKENSEMKVFAQNMIEVLNRMETKFNLIGLK